jgi:hypothetical protein
MAGLARSIFIGCRIVPLFWCKSLEGEAFCAKASSSVSKYFPRFYGWKVVGIGVLLPR